ncbi:MAG: thiamine phosphate synthase [Xanthobacteraceae bacterium]
MPYPDRFYPVVDSVAWVARLAALGVGTIQLRMKNLAPDEAVATVRAALQAVAGTAVKLVVNDWWQAAIAAGAAHVHLGQEDLVDADVTAIRRAGLTLGLSTHDDAELDNALRHDPDYVALGPIYPTTLKVMRFAPQGLARITEWKRRIGRTPLVTIGGISLERAPAVFAAGADSIAVVSDVTQNSDPEGRVRDWLELTNRPRQFDPDQTSPTRRANARLPPPLAGEG